MFLNATKTYVNITIYCIRIDLVRLRMKIVLSRIRFAGRIKDKKAFLFHPAREADPVFF